MNMWWYILYYTVSDLAAGLALHAKRKAVGKQIYPFGIKAFITVQHLTDPLK